MSDSTTPCAGNRLQENIHRSLSEWEVVQEAHRCLYCYDAPCIKACPTHIDVPSFIQKILTGNFTGSAKVIMEANPMGASCARVCPQKSCAREHASLAKKEPRSALATCSAMLPIGYGNGKLISLIGGCPPVGGWR